MPASAARPRVAVVMGGLMLVMLLASLDQTIVSTALPTIVGDLGGLAHLSWVVTAYLLAVTVVTPLYGKLGDLYGRKVVLQGALVVFLIGSALCGLAQGMTELIAFRAIQGLGGGGLMVSAQAAIGDVVAPSQRGRYTGLFGAVFGVSSVAGPLIGGFLTTHISWRFIFYVNVPVGIAAFAVLAATLPSTTDRRRHALDWAGTLLLALGLSSLILLTTLGGNTFEWASWQIVAMGIVAVLALVAFVLAERRAAEPILPPELFRNRVFVVCGAVGLVVGFALFGALTYLPLFQQVVRGLSPTASGLQLLPVMGGLLVSSIVSGQVITRTGRYKAFPIAGTAVAAAGMFMLSSLDETTGTGVAALHMLVLGLGLGMVMQVLVLAVQNAVPYEQLGVATSGATLFRSMGGSLGTAVLGAIFTGRLTAELSRVAAAGGGERHRGRQPGADRAPPGADPRRVHLVVHGRAQRRVPGGRRGRGAGVPDGVADRGAPAAGDDRDRDSGRRLLCRSRRDRLTAGDQPRADALRGARPDAALRGGRGRASARGAVAERGVAGGAGGCAGRARWTSRRCAGCPTSTRSASTRRWRRRARAGIWASRRSARPGGRCGPSWCRR